MHRQNSQTNLVMVIVVSAWLIVLQSSSVVNEGQHEPQGKMLFSSPPHTTVESLECLWFTNTNIPSIQDARRPFLSFFYPFFFKCLFFLLLQINDKCLFGLIHVKYSANVGNGALDKRESDVRRLLT